MADAVPNQTLYLNNLSDKLSKEKLRRQLYNVCSKFGSVLDIIVHPGQAMRGQAWVVFGSVETATKALSKLNGYPLFSKNIKAQFARENADVVAKLEGKFVARPKRKAETSLDNENRNTKRSKVGTEDNGDGASAPAAVTAGGGHDSNNPPGPILKIDNIPEDEPSDALVELFSKYEGYLDLRHVPVKMLAFAEYRTTEQAKVAREGLRGHQISSSHKLRVNFAKPRE